MDVYYLVGEVIIFSFLKEWNRCVGFLSRVINALVFFFLILFIGGVIIDCIICEWNIGNVFGIWN